jgi:hypothetical protein
MKIDGIIFESSIDLGKKRTKAIDEMIELHLQPKPRWMPAFLWKALIKRMLLLKEY